MLSLPTLVAGLGFLATAAWAAPYTVTTRRSASGQSVVYWGQNGGGTIENNDLGAYCTSTSGIDIIILSFLYQYGNGNTIPGGGIGQSCGISTSGQGQNCDNVAKSIPICQAAGIKVVLSLGGASGGYTLTSQAEAEAIGQYLWDSYGNSGNTSVQRPSEAPSLMVGTLISRTPTAPSTTSIWSPNYAQTSHQTAKIRISRPRPRNVQSRNQIWAPSLALLSLITSGFSSTTTTTIPTPAPSDLTETHPSTTTNGCHSSLIRLLLVPRFSLGCQLLLLRPTVAPAARPTTSHPTNSPSLLGNTRAMPHSEAS